MQLFQTNVHHVCLVQKSLYSDSPLRDSILFVDSLAHALIVWPIIKSRRNVSHTQLGRTQPLGEHHWQTTVKLNVHSSTVVESSVSREASQCSIVSLNSIAIVCCLQQQ